ncbi:beta-mannosidase [Rhodococcus sp. 14-2470-1b]|uniref:glycosyl hydrolase 2 galactose-binding domain-containing protein n=1 Tax=Rhodococcus sp. 14-2470-1b TaxID=2023149 RepID=UPI000B9A732C|nr:beta-mannosidase [Rhodococcus sp. 14-2470-1b]OZF55183.1 beta-mannosidase [Rhodococcus sp. 14-2470-1b]
MTPNLLPDAHISELQWRVAAVAPGSVAHPDELEEDLVWTRARVPGSVAASTTVAPPDSVDWWFTTTVTAPGGGASVLTFDGIATHATVWIDGIESAGTSSMFAPVSVDIPPRSGDVQVAVRVDSMDARLKQRKPRGRWRSSLVDRQGLRHERTSLLGRAPVYGQVPPVVGLWRAVTLRERGSAEDIRVHAELSGADGTVRVRARLTSPAASVSLRVGDHSFDLPGSEGELDVTVTVPDVSRWWPHTHGDPALYTWELEVGSRVEGRGSLGFRQVELELAGASVAFTVNGTRVFARGGCWVPLDPVRMWVEADALREELTSIRDAGLNMVRVVGTMVYEQPEFWSLCAELGILVWQDVMFATTDPPTGGEFLDAVHRELDAVSAIVGGNPALAVVSGGSETQQQPTMLGVPLEDQRIELLESVIPEFIARRLPGTPYVTSSPSSISGELHTHVGDGIGHYFGVGGYLRPLSDIRTARVRFAAECLAFAVPPERRAVDAMFGTANVAGHHPDWKSAIPRDRGSSWDFEDVRDHYVREIFGVDPHLTRRDDAELYLDYGRAAVCEAVHAAYSHWRRADSECAGALVLTLRDLVPGAGWGLRDSAGTPKAPWYSLARLSTPICVFIVDDGLDGLAIQAANDTGNSISGYLRAVLFGPSGPMGEPAEARIDLGPHTTDSVSLDRLLGSFTDANHAYRFGGQTYSAVVVELVGADGSVLDQATHLIGDRHPRQNDVGLSATAENIGPDKWSLTVSTRWAAHYVCVDIDGMKVSDSWFHLAPGAARVLTLTGAKTTVSGHVRALNSIKRAQIS